MMEIKAYKVSKIVEYMQDLLEDDMVLCGLWVAGEVSNFVAHASGHLFFSLKDDAATLRCVIFKNEAAELPEMPQNGSFVKIYGRISLYRERGEIRLIGEFLDVEGKGDISKDLEILKEELLKEGVFENSRPLPHFPRKICIITSPTGAAIADMLKIVKGRNHLVEVAFVPALVQGEAAPADIVRALAVANVHSNAEVLILGRGGGSAEDLWAFNSEVVARAVHASKIPIISAVGHETDFTLCDFAADVRAATPTHAAEMAVPSHLGMVRMLEGLANALNQALNSRIAYQPARLQAQAATLNRAISAKFANAKRDLLQKADVLEVISPMAVLRRGFTIAKDSNGNVIKNGENLKTNDTISLTFSDTIREAKIL